MNTSQNKKQASMGGTNRQSMIQDILEESDGGYDEEVDMYRGGQLQNKKPNNLINNFDIDKSNEYNSIKNYGYDDKERSHLNSTPKSMKPQKKSEQLIPARASTQLSQDYGNNKIDISNNLDQGSAIDPDMMF